ncbi:hypothetical protein K491DRAFT_578018, partial [Lophiostoma macrostomum CBS 122681]
STRAITPTHSGPFSAPNAPDTPGSIRANSSAIAQNASASATFGAHLTKSPRGLSPRHSPQPLPLPLTGAAAMADERRHQQETSRQTSPNPAIAVVQNLLGTAQSAMSRTRDGPPEPAQMSAPLEKAAKALVIPDQVTSDHMQTSPVSLSSFGSNDLTTAATATATDATAGPMPGQESVAQHVHGHHHQPIAPNPGDVPSSRAFTFPGPLPPEHVPARQMSLPGYPQNSPKAISPKRHKCPYCSTDFTRHHNLKSHLLTHSQEKPYECPTCQARFRRLHDLKRHTKLHTGERPHTCPKCGRRFARGDALARHNKGQGGCAGRRSSFGMDDDMGDKGDESMDGIVYHDGDGDDDDDGDGGRRVSEPARKRQNTGNSTQGSYHQHSSTYPPLAASRAPMGHNSNSNSNSNSNNHNNLRPLYPPGSSMPSREPSTNMSPKVAPSSISSLHFNAANQPNVFSQGGMTESPKPISPGHAEHHRLGAPDASYPPPRSPSLTQQMHQQHISRAAGRGSSPMALAPPHSAGGPLLPSLPGLNPMISKQGSQAGKNGPSMLHQQVSAPGPASQPGSMSSHGASSAGSMREIIGNQPNDMYAYLREVEGRMARMNEEHEKKLQSMQDEITTLRAQLAQ